MRRFTKQYQSTSTDRRPPHWCSLHRVACALSGSPLARSASANSHSHSDRSPLQRLVPATAWRLSAPLDPVWSEFQAAVLRRRASGSSPVARPVVDTSWREGLPECRSAIPLTLPIRFPRSSAHPRPARPDWTLPVRRHGPECLPGTSCRRAGRNGSSALPSPFGTASSEASGSSLVFPGSSPITSPLLLQKHI